MSEIHPPSLKCERCDEVFVLNMMALHAPLEDLPDPFLAKCSECGHNATYPKAAMQAFVDKR